MSQLSDERDERRERFIGKVSSDLNGSRLFYKKFMGVARVTYGVGVLDAEDVWADVVSHIICKGPGGTIKLDTYNYSIDETTPLYEDKNLSRWLMSCLLNRCVDHLRKNLRREKIVGRNIDDLFQDYDSYSDHASISPLRNIAGKEEDPLEYLLHMEDYKHLHEGIKRLKPRQQALLERFYFKGMRYQEIADDLDIPLGTVKSKLHGAVKKLREIFCAA